MKQLLKENIHVDVEPETKLYYTDERIIKVCRSIKEQIMRHIDDVAQVVVTWESLSVCSFCKSNWEVNEDPLDPDLELDEPMCCEEAQKEWKKSKESGE